MAFYTFMQNNSGGLFDVNSNISHYVIIESTSADAANRHAERIGLYFDGCNDGGPDCPCCGDRWYRADDSDATTSPLVYGDGPNNVEPYLISEGEPYVIVYYMDGTKKVYFAKRGEK